MTAYGTRRAGRVALFLAAVALPATLALHRFALRFCREPQVFGNLNLRQAHSRLSAYADAAWSTARIDGPAVLKPVDEASFVSTNDTAQYGLAAIQCLTLVGNHLPREMTP